MTKSGLRITSRVSSIVCCDSRIASRGSATISAVRRAIASPSGDRAKPGRHSISNNPLLPRSFRERLHYDMRRINAWIERASITFIDDEGEPVDVHDRTLRRLFVIHEGDPLRQRFDLSGRLFGGFWQGLQRERRSGIRIDGEPVATLDYSSMFARLAYASKGVQPPTGDLYAIPGLEDRRDAVKLGVNALLFDQHARRQWPKSEEPGQRLPLGWTLGRFRRALVERHPVIAECIGKGLGFHLMHTESEIMARVLTTLLSEGVTALPLHDGMLVRRSHASNGKAAMEEVSREMTSYV